MQDCLEEIFGGPCRGRTYGQLIKSLDEDLPSTTSQDLSSLTDRGEG